MMTRAGGWIVPPHQARVRLDQFMLSLIPDQSRSQIQSWIRGGLVRVNGAQVKTGLLLRTGDEISLQPPQSQPAGPFPENIPINVIYEDDDLAVVDKPSGMVCHLGAGVHSGTLVNALLHRLGPLEAGDPARPGIVHRLDKLTSGILVVAKNNSSHRNLAEQFKSRQVRKEYIALVHGLPKPAVGTIDLPLGRDPKDRKKISTRARRRRSAITHYRVERDYGSLALLRVRIETGRTHQIRVHLAQKGHPVVGDRLYGGNRELPALVPSTRLDRLFLHAHRLEFRHPRTGLEMTFTCPLPEAFADFLGRLG